MLLTLSGLSLRALTDSRIIFESSRRFIGNGFSWLPSRARKRAKNRKKNLGHNKSSANVIHVNLFFPPKFDKAHFKVDINNLTKFKVHLKQETWILRRVETSSHKQRCHEVVRHFCVIPKFKSRAIFIERRNNKQANKQTGTTERRAGKPCPWLEMTNLQTVDYNFSAICAIQKVGPSLHCLILRADIHSCNHNITYCFILSTINIYLNNIISFGMNKEHKLSYLHKWK